MSTETTSNQSYYGQPFAARQIVMQMQGSNPGADPLRDVLTKRFGTRDRAWSTPARGAGGAGGAAGYAPAYPSYPAPGGQPATWPGSRRRVDWDRCRSRIWRRRRRYEVRQHRPPRDGGEGASPSAGEGRCQL